MCGVIGAFIKNPDAEDFDLLRTVFVESEVRGLHASGLSYIKDQEVVTVKDAIRAGKFLEDKNFSDFVNEDGNLYLVGHIRYSTSDLRYNQPISNNHISVVHNGVISQENSSEWKYKTETQNDSELVLKSFESGANPLNDFPDSSQAVCVLWRNMQGSPSVMAYRNGKRPLWYSKAGNYFIVTSTEDIARRAKLKNTKRCDANTFYIHNRDFFTIDNETMGMAMEDIQP